VRLVDDDRVGAVLHRLAQLGELREDEREPLQRRDDHPGLLALEGGAQLRRVLVDLADRARHLLERLHLRLELAVEHLAIGDDDDLVEDRRPMPAVQRREIVGQPGDLLALARARRVLDQVAVARPVHPGVGRAGTHDVPLMEAREDHRSVAPPSARPLRPLLDEHELLDQLHPGVALPHGAPYVLGRMPAGRRWGVAGAAGLPRAAGALVEGQESRAPAVEVGGHIREVGVQREVHEGAATEQHVRGRAVLAVLADRVVDRLPGVAVLQLRGGGRNAVDEQHEVDAVARLGVETHLANHPQEIRVVEDACAGLQLEIGLEERQSQRDPLLGDAASQCSDRSTLVELVSDPLEEVVTRGLR
jgi:hypothetical protein